MRKRYIAITMGLVLGLSVLSGCGTNSSNSSASQEANVEYGQVSEVSDDSITIEVGTQKQMEKPDDAKDSNSDSNSDNNSDSSSDKKDDSSDSNSNSDAKDNSSNSNSSSDAKDNSSDSKSDNKQEAPSMLDLTGEEKEIEVTSSTVINKQSMGQPQGQAPGQNSDSKSGNNTGSDSSKSDDNTTGNSKNENNTNSNSDSKSDNNTNSSSDSQTGQSTPPEKPNGDSGNGQGQPQGQAPDQSSSEQKTETISLSDISEGDIVEITYDDDGNVSEITVMFSAQGGQGGPGGQSTAAVDSYEAVKTYSSDTTVKSKTLASTGTDENAALVSDGAKVTFSNATLTRKSSDSTGGDNSSFYGVGAALLTTDGTSYVKDSTVTTDSAGGAGLFAYNKGTVYAADSTIKTTQDTSGGIHVAGGGSLYAWNLNVETNGESSAAIRSDRGGGKMVVDGGTYTSNGVGSPAIYSVADVAVRDATLIANGSEAICIEGMNSIHLYDSDLTGNMSDNSQNDCTWNVILYQSMSGDSEEGNSTFEMDGGSLTAKNGGMFYTTNTESTITLKDVDISNASDSEFFLKCTGNQNQRGWGQSGSNGADCLFTAIDQDMEGDIIWDSISQLDFYMTDGSTLKGAVTDDESCAGDGGSGYCNLYIEKGSTWTVTGDSTLSELQNAGTITDADGNTVTIKGTDGTVYVKGTSKYTVTVKSYKTSADTSKASKTTSWSSYETAKPSELS